MFLAFWASSRPYAGFLATGSEPGFFAVAEGVGLRCFLLLLRFCRSIHQTRHMRIPRVERPHPKSFGRFS